jgi:hypothetical protein
MGRKSKLGTAVLVALAWTSATALAQGHEDQPRTPRWDFALEGMLGVAIGPDFYAFNVGGPSLLLQVHRHWKVGVGALPSFYVKEGNPGAKLGASPRVDYKNSLVLIAPFFHFEHTNRWVWSVGLGYKFHRKRKT